MVTNGWKQLTSHYSHIELPLFINGLKHDCGMPDTYAYAWVEYLTKFYQGTRHVNFYSAPVGDMFFFDEYEKLLDVDAKTIQEMLRDQAYRDIQSEYDGIYLNKREIIRYTTFTCNNRGIKDRESMLPKCIQHPPPVEHKETKPRTSANMRAVATFLAVQVCGEDFHHHPEKSAGCLCAALRDKGFDVNIDGDWIKRNTTQYKVEVKKVATA
ncbi:MAG: hypothetical protein ACRC5A_09310 [Enterobacteriaceae bacterium]